ncbi:lysozyme inhibitor LprI family protein [Variovorax sp. J22R133]|uniref:lysozyme inhibitor LprI family protein n=1 Tax=Variovorax brevis TaxID=3053503 RepID=UPI0025788E93|nr:lysozyme inhibitor LprI family protein [Variovorax sp. J22R133]MDM0112712.1 lysozyme inhibitor LprI family protein [Variovorax sp. J22R133]
MRLIVLPLLLLSLATPALAQMFGPEYATCSNGNTAQIVDCVGKLTKTWDRRLNTAYQALMQRVDPGQKDPLKAAQRLWIQYRDANCKVYASGEGSIHQVEAAECLHAMTQQRTCELEATSLGEGKPGAGCK